MRSGNEVELSHWASCGFLYFSFPGSISFLFIQEPGDELVWTGELLLYCESQHNDAAIFKFKAAGVVVVLDYLRENHKDLWLSIGETHLYGEYHLLDVMIIDMKSITGKFMNAYFLLNCVLPSSASYSGLIVWFLILYTKKIYFKYFIVHSWNKKELWMNYELICSHLMVWSRSRQNILYGVHGLCMCT
jgi:hypothetical protein